MRPLSTLLYSSLLFLGHASMAAEDTKAVVSETETVQMEGDVYEVGFCAVCSEEQKGQQAKMNLSVKDLLDKMGPLNRVPAKGSSPAEEAFYKGNAVGSSRDRIFNEAADQMSLKNQLKRVRTFSLGDDGTTLTVVGSRNKFLEVKTPFK